MVLGQIGGLFDSGKKWASGTATLGSGYMFDLAPTSGLSTSHVDIPLSFTPSVIVVTGTDSSNTYEYTSVYENQGVIYEKEKVKFASYYGNTRRNTCMFKASASIKLANNVYRIPIVANDAQNIRWIAYE